MNTPATAPGDLAVTGAPPHPPTEQLEQLEQLAGDCLRWISGHADRFRLPAEMTDPTAGTELNWTMKPLGELAQLAVAIRRATPPGCELHATADQLLDLSWHELRQGELLLELFHGEPHATYPLEIYAAFAGEGLRHDGFEAFARDLCATRAWRGTEMDPQRRLGVINAERRARLTPTGDRDAALRRTWLGVLPEPWAFDQSAGYSLTHVVFHITDWGARPQQVPADIAGYLRTWLPAWLDTCLDAERWDLTCELLAVDSALPTPLDPRHTRPAWRRLAAARGPDGALPEGGPALLPEHPDAFRLSYHSTLACAFAAALAAGRLRAAEAAPPPERPHGGGAPTAGHRPSPRDDTTHPQHRAHPGDTDGATSGRREEQA
ncbi:DUF6895 family protein [Streptomyces spiramenti]|uniref:DUF6895 domain-containing protein n=1 Tax=Streptomyces spiramenti TaxID=2720606 RepID=A0ABX1AFW6_9ACTN|nr:hypothetical protein [Streptomyces spiramenti]NJP66082.1 hypothetical protein [Streptomyces spiramenti]